jgi:hypothetical protein
MVVAQLRRWRFHMAVLAGSWPDSRQWLSDGVGRGSILLCFFFCSVTFFAFFVFSF